MSIFERFLKFKGYDIDRASAELREIHALNEAEFRQWQDAQRWSIVKHHAQYNPIYREKLKDGIPDNWNDLPIMDKKDYQKPIAEMLSEGTDPRQIHVDNTSGSSGHPFYYAKDKYSHAMVWAVVKHRYGLYNIRLNSLQARFYGIPFEWKGYLRETIKDKIMSRVRFPVFDLSPLILEKFYQRFKWKKFEYVYGYTSSIVLFARYLLEKGYNLKKTCPSLRCCIVTSEVCTAEDKRLIEEAFGVPVVNEYGASELGIISFQYPDGNYYLTEESLFVEVVSEQDTKATEPPGTILVTSFTNKAMPFIRYKIGDMGKISKPATGWAYYNKIDEIQGRVNDVVRLPGGKVSPGLTFYYISRSILESSGALKEFIIKQVALDRFIFEVVADRELTTAEIYDIQQKMDDYLQPNLHLEIKMVDKIERPASGKIKHFYSLLKD